MRKISLSLFLSLIFSLFGISQCPDLSNNVLVNGTTNTDFSLCGTQSVTFSVDDVNLPTGTIDWFSSPVSGFDPATSGTLIGSSTINSTANPCTGLCPTIEAIYIDACGDEGLNEFVVVGSGSGLNIDDLSFSFDVANTGGFGGPAPNGNINVGGACDWIMGDPSLVTGCSNIIVVGSGDYVPPNSTIIIQTSNFGVTTYDVSGICGSSECIYLVRNSCDRLIGGFSNCGAGTGVTSERVNTLELTCGCSDVLTYDILNPDFLAVCAAGANGMHVFADLTYANNGCNIGPNVSSIPQFPLSATIDPFNYTFSSADCNNDLYIVGVLNSNQENEDCCSEQITSEYSFNISCPEAQLSGVGSLCPGECTQIDVLFTGGETPYELDMQVTTPLFPITFTLPGFEANDQITICYDSLGPPLDPATNTVNVPSFLGGFTGDLELLNFTDDQGCAGTITGGVIAIDFNDAPDVVSPPTVTECDMGDGTAFFILSDLNIIVNNGSGLQVNYYSDAMGLNPIPNVYQTGTTIIYAQVIDNPCSSDIVPINLEVISNGDAGVVNMFCNTGDGNSLECTICDDDNISGEEVDITIVFQDGSIEYDYIVNMTTLSGVSIDINGTAIGGSATITQDIFETTTFTVILVDPNNDCPDMTDLGDPVTIFYGVLPDMDNPGDLSNCGSVTLPPITGNIIPANAGYYSMPGGMGTILIPGEEISTNTTLYLYGGFDGCEQEIEIEVNILSSSMINNPGDITTCGSFILPAITGVNVDNANYYTETNGGGNELAVGTNIVVDSEIFIFDPVCPGIEESFMVSITPGAVITTGPDTIVCDTFILEMIEGVDLTGAEAYYELPDGLGQQILVGDTITQDTTIYIYDNTPGCIIEVPFVITISTPGFPGLDSTVVICEGDATLYDINTLLGGNTPDTIGFWVENGTNIISDSSAVDFSSLLTGQYTFDYMISDSICLDTSSTLTVNIIGNVNAGTDTLLVVCEDITNVNVFDLLGNPDQGGVFLDNTGAPAPFDPLDASFTTVTPGFIIYSYIVGDPLSSCGADTSIFSVITGQEVNAGEDIGQTICAGQPPIMLSSLLMNNTDIGVFSEPVISGGLDGAGIFNSALVSDGEYVIYHILQGSGQCPSDTATITLTVVDGPNAGDEQEVELCSDDLTLDLSSVLDPAADPNGVFYFGNNAISDPSIDFTGVSGEEEYLYIVGDGVSCPFDTAVLTIKITPIPSTSLTLDVASVCSDECATFTLFADASTTQTLTLFYQITNNNGDTDSRTAIFDDTSSPLSEEFCEGDGSLISNIVEPNNTYILSFDSIYVDGPECVFFLDDIQSFEVGGDTDTLLQNTYCLDDVIPVGTDIYDVNTQDGTTIISNASGCDSTITVDFTFLSEVPGTFVATECEGDTVTVFGIDYTTDFTSDTTLIGASSSGCDSIVSIDISFLENEMEDYIRTKCSGETENLGGILFSEANNSGTAIIENGASNGCDLILDVFFTYLDQVEVVLDTMVCDNYSIEIAGETYDINNPTGMEILPSGSMNECDTTIMIDLDFSLMGIDSSIVLSTCDDGLFFVIGNETFNRTNPSGTSTVDGLNGECDTTFTVDITYGVMQVDLEEIDAGCEVIDSGLVIINNINGVPPYNIIYNGNNTIAFVLPVEIELPAGMGSLLVTDDNGCESTIPYEILEGNDDGDFEIVQNGNQLNIIGGIVDSVSWLPDESLSCIDCIDPIVSPTITTIYTANVFYGGECEIEIEYIFQVIDDIPDYILPGVFSPNNDGANENFTLFLTDGAIGVPQSMVIFDRWGNNVATVQGQDIIQVGWDGRKDGSSVAEGVYVYKIEILEQDKLLVLYGDVTVIR